MIALRDVNKSGAQVAKEAGISLACLSKNYAYYFAPFLDTKTLAEREIANHKARASAKATELASATTEENAVIKKIVDHARAAGLSVICPMRQAKETQQPIGAYQRTVVISGKKCSIRVLTKGRRMNKRDVQVYASTSINRSMLDEFDVFILLVQDPSYEERLLVIPSSDIREHYFSRTPNASARRISIPLLPRAQNKTARLDFGTYQNAWSALRLPALLKAG